MIHRVPLLHLRLDSAYKHTTSGIAEADELYQKIDAVMVSTDEASRQSLYADIMKIVHDEAVFIPITNGRVTVVAPENLDGIHSSRPNMNYHLNK